MEDDTGFPVPAGELRIEVVEREDIEGVEALVGNNVPESIVEFPGVPVMIGRMIIVDDDARLETEDTAMLLVDELELGIEEPGLDTMVGRVS